MRPGPMAIVTFRVKTRPFGCSMFVLHKRVQTRPFDVLVVVESSTRHALDALDVRARRVDTRLVDSTARPCSIFDALDVEVVPDSSSTRRTLDVLEARARCVNTRRDSSIRRALGVTVNVLDVEVRPFDELDVVDSSTRRARCLCSMRRHSSTFDFSFMLDTPRLVHSKCSGRGRRPCSTQDSRLVVHSTATRMFNVCGSRPRGDPRRRVGGAP